MGDVHLKFMWHSLFLWGAVVFSCHSPATMTPFEAASGKPVQVVSPAPSQAEGSYPTPTLLSSISLTCSTENSTVKYTLDGSNPAMGQTYTTPFSITKNTLLRAQAFKSGFPDSGIYQGYYRVGASTPVLRLHLVDGTTRDVCGDFTSGLGIQSIDLVYHKVGAEAVTSVSLTFSVDGGVDSTVNPDSSGVVSGITPGLSVNHSVKKIVAHSAYGSWQDSETLTANLTIDAAATYKVAYNPNWPVGSGTSGGSPPVDNSSYAAGSAVAVKGPGDLTFNNYTFAGWSLSSNGGGTLYSSLGPNPTYTISADTTFYAVWTSGVGWTTIEPGSYSVVINGNPHQPRTLYFGQQFTFQASPDPDAAISYLWYQDGVLVSGATTAQYKLTPTSALTYGPHRVTVYTGFGNGFTYSDTLNITVRNPVSRTGLVSEWLFERPDALSIYDTGGVNNYDGTLGGSPNPLLVAGGGPCNSNSCQFTAGSNSSVAMVSSPNLNFSKTSAFSISFWCYVTSGGNLMTNCGNNNSFQYWFEYSSGKINFHIGANAVGTNQWTASTPLAVNGWHHIVGLYGGGVFDLYVDGVCMFGAGVGSSSFTGSYGQAVDTSQSPLTLGPARPGYTNSFSGQLARCRIYNRCLSDSEIVALYYE